MPTPRFLNLARSLAANAACDAGDVYDIKTLLADLGHYQVPDWGLSEYPDRALFDAIRAYQKERGLKADGVMQQGGETEISLRTLQTQALQAQAQELRSKGRFGDTILAHISPEEARLLKAHGGAGTINPATGLLEFYDSAQKEGKYIWRTRGDGKVRSAHAERNGETFSWNDPPEGGHPGEAPNCRCWAEDVASKDSTCEELKRLMDEAWDRHDALQEPILRAEDKVFETEQRLDDLQSELEDVQHEILMLAIQDRPSKTIGRGTIFDLGAMAYQYTKLKERESQLLSEINGVKWVLGKAKEKLDRLKRERDNEQQYAKELSRRYKVCQEENGKVG